jgi:O-succinylbenzoic acid--CoA ligase
VSRTLRALPCPTGPEVLDVWLPALAAALDGRGPALVPVPGGPAGAAVTTMARLDEPVDADAPDDVALVVPTSGSTGVPKGAMLTAAALRASGAATEARVGGPGRWLLALPVTHVAGQQVLLRSLLAGTTPEVLDLAGGFDPVGFATATDRLGDVRRYTSLVPTQLGRLLDAGGAAVDAVCSYDAVLLGGAAAPPALLERAAAAGARVLTTYGMSETCGGCVYSGLPLDGVQVRLDDRLDDTGRIALGGDVVFSGYRLRPDLTAEAWEVDANGVRWHLTRDLGRLAGERLDVVGRVDDLIVTGAEKVAPLAVEAAVAALPAVRDVVVVGLPDPEWGQRVVAVVVLADRHRPPTLPDLRDALREALPGHALPRQLHVVDAIPLLDSGKPDRAGVRAAVPRDG